MLACTRNVVICNLWLACLVLLWDSRIAFIVWSPLCEGERTFGFSQNLYLSEEDRECFTWGDVNNHQHIVEPFGYLCGVTWPRFWPCKGFLACYGHQQGLGKRPSLHFLLNSLHTSLYSLIVHLLIDLLKIVNRIGIYATKLFCDGHIIISRNLVHI
jgi:hypothetical protein